MSTKEQKEINKRLKYQEPKRTLWRSIAYLLIALTPLLFFCVIIPAVIGLFTTGLSYIDLLKATFGWFGGIGMALILIYVSVVTFLKR